MNFFEYTLKVQEVDIATTKVKKRTLFKEAVDSLSKYGTVVQSDLYKFKLATYIVHTYPKETSMAQRIGILNTIGGKICGRYIAGKITKETLYDIFEFSRGVVPPTDNTVKYGLLNNHRMPYQVKLEITLRLHNESI